MSEGTQKQTEVNEVPLSPFLDKSVQTFLRAVKDDQWSNEDEPRHSVALVIVMSSDGSGTVDVNVANRGLTDETQDKMVKAALQAINGEPLFVRVG